MSRASATRAPKPAASAGHLELAYTLAELPSSQHRAGLAGLVLMAEWLGRYPERRGTFEINELDEEKVRLTLDEAGLAWAFDELYDASVEEIEVDKPRKDRDGEVVPLRTVERDVEDKKGKGGVKKKTRYVYTQIVPRGAWLLAHDPAAEGDKGPWVKLWRDFVWSILRGIHTQRRPFEVRAEAREQQAASLSNKSKAEVAKDARDEWAQLRDGADATVDLPSTYYLGAQATSAESVPFRDRARYRFLLHFWPLVAPIYVPRALDPREEKPTLPNAFAVAIPDVARLETFCRKLTLVLKARSTDMAGFRPKEAVVDLAVESALDMARRLRDRVAATEGDKKTQDLVFGFDVVHSAKEGNNVRTLSVTRLEPEARMIDEYTRLRSAFGDPFFRRARLLNLVQERRWFAGFDELFAVLPYKKQGFGSAAFRRDARGAFEERAMTGDEANDGESAPDGTELERAIYRMVRTYVLRKVESKSKLTWGAVKGTPQEKEYTQAKEKVAKDAFLAVRSRTGDDFLEYFAGTIGSVPHHLGEERFVAFTRALRNDPGAARTLTMLALSAVG
jgi:CRISPR-associated protein Cmx8